VSRTSRPPIDPESARDLNQPSARDRDRIRENIGRSLARGSASQTVLRVDAAMAERALGSAASSAGLFGSKAAIAKLLIPALLIGAGVGAIWARSLFDRGAPSEQENRSLPVQVEDLDPLDTPGVPDVRVARAAGFAAEAPSNPDARHPDTASPQPPAHPARAHRPHAARTSPTAATEVTPAPVAEPTTAEAPQTPSHHLAEELRLMRAASTALAANDIQRTLDLLSQHAERFPAGALREERRALRVISLCEQGRSHFALAERDEFLSSSPRSPLTARVREACESRQ
jgi:hypothetical protein